MEPSDLLEQIPTIGEQAEKEALSVTDAEELEAWRVRYLGRKGVVAGFTANLGTLAPALRAKTGAAINTLKNTITALFEEKKAAMTGGTSSLNLSFPGKKVRPGMLHPLTLTVRAMTGIFSRLGFGIHTGPDIESDFYNFQALNTPEDHPARDVWDTFYLDQANGLLLRTHTSPVQIRIMEKMKPPFRIVSVGRCYRRDAFDARHSPVFHQMEGLMVGEGITFAHLRGVLTLFLRETFGEALAVKFLPAYFPFTEPSAEVAISCVVCGGKGCGTCGQSGWLEILGCGMVHPQVFRNVGYDPAVVTGFAFGMGIERIAMLKYQIADIRHFTLNDVRFIEQIAYSG